MQINETTTSSIAEYVACVEGLLAEGPRKLWYRGCRDHNWKLRPRLLRHPNPANHGGLVKLERAMVERFQRQSVPMVQSDFGTDEWSLLFYMQHYGIPTRLLDWTESPLIGLWFALEQATADVDMAVWVLDSSAWNRKSLGVATEDDLPVDMSTVLSRYSSKTGAVVAEYPVAISGAHNSQRIVAQRGVFTLFGQGDKPMDDLVAEDIFPPDSLFKIVIPKDQRATLMQSLRNLGFTESVVYPDLYGLAMEFTRDFGFEV